MGNLPHIRQPLSRQATLSIPLYWADHRSRGRAVLPAVEAMQLLANWTRSHYPRLDVGTLSQASFDKFLPLPPATPSLPVRYEVSKTDAGRVRATLMTKKVAKTVSISRPIVHARMDFGKRTAQPGDITHEAISTSGDEPFRVDAERIYAELVPFGPAYHNLRGQLQLWAEGVEATIQAPDPGNRRGSLPLGSPFVLDAAFHAACVWSQRYADVVAYPVGIDSRSILKPTRGGNDYQATVKPVSTDPSLLVFDILIFESDGSCCEVVKGVRMRDVSGGRLKPPLWIRANHERIG